MIIGAVNKLRHAEEGGISQCDDVYIKHTSVWDNVTRGGGGVHNGQI